MSGRLSLVLVCAAALAGCEPAPPRETLDAHSFHTHLQRLASVAAEAALFTKEFAAGHLTPAYAWVHQQALGGQVRSISGDLAQPAPANLQAPQRDALVLATNLQLELTRVAPSGSDAAALRAVQAQFDLLHRQAQALGASQ